MIGQQDRHNMIVKEIAIMRQIGMHPYTPSCHDAYKDATSYYIIMELCTGGELFDLIIHQVRVHSQMLFACHGCSCSHPAVRLACCQQQVMPTVCFKLDSCKESLSMLTKLPWFAQTALAKPEAMLSDVGNAKFA